MESRLKKVVATGSRAVPAESDDIIADKVYEVCVRKSFTKLNFMLILLKAI